MLKAVAAEIYRKHCAVPIRYDDLPAGFDYSVFDAAINSGFGRVLPWRARRSDENHRRRCRRKDRGGFVARPRQRSGRSNEGLAAMLADAIASSHPAATAQIQADLHKAPRDLSTETAAVGGCGRAEPG
jgi:lysozyme family protein